MSRQRTCDRPSYIQETEGLGKRLENVRYSPATAIENDTLFPDFIIILYAVLLYICIYIYLYIAYSFYYFSLVVRSL